MTDLAKLVVKLEAQTAQYMAQLDKANKRLEKFDRSASISASRIAGGVAAAAAAAAVSFGALAYQAIDTADKMGEMAEASGVAVESLSQLDYAAKLGGTSFENLNKGMVRLSRAATEAARGSDTAKKAFGAIGVSVKDANGNLKGTEEILLDVADRFSKLEDGAGKAALAQELFGKSGVELIPFLNKGREGIEALKREAAALGLTITSEAAEAAGQFNDDLDRLRGSAQGLANQAAAELLPMLSVLSENFTKAAMEGGAFDAAIKAISVTLKTLVTAGVIVVSIFQQIGRAIYGNAQMLWALANKDFKGAARIIKETVTDIKSNVSKDIDTIVAIWADKVPQMAETAKATDETLKETLIFNDEKAEDAAKKAADAALKQISNLEQGVREQVETFGEGEAAVMRYRLAHGDLAETFREAGDAAEPYKDKLIDLTQKLEDLKQSAQDTDEMMRGIDDSIKRDIERNREVIEGELETMIEVKDEMDKFEERAKENLQDILGEGIEGILENGVKKGAEGALDAFTNMLQKMAIQAIAANLAGKIFGSTSTGFGTSESGGGGWLAAGLDFIFGGSRDKGGRGQKGHAYFIGTGAQPEMFVPDTSGEFIPATAWAGGGRGGVVQNIYVQGRVDQRTARQMELEASRRQRVASARLG